jgi:hypothetical protein
MNAKIYSEHLRVVIRSIDAEIHLLSAARAALLSYQNLPTRLAKHLAEEPAPAPAKKRSFSAETRARMSASQKRRRAKA